MLASLLESFTSGIGDLLEMFVDGFLGALNISDLGSYLNIFPILTDVYFYLRGISVALTALIAGVAFWKFNFSSLTNSEAKDHPVGILFKAAAAVCAIYWGGYVLEYIVHLASIPYDAFLGIDVVNQALGTDGPDIKPLKFVADLVAFLGGEGQLSLGAMMAELLLLCIIAWNLFKLAVEVCERWLMVGVLLYTAPLAYCTIPSSDTSQIFRRWVSMFIGAAMQMSLSVLFLKLILSGFNASNVNYTIQLLMILAMCKIAQRVDSYLQQLGIGAPTTGGSMLDDIIAGAKTMTNISERFGKAGSPSSQGGSRQGILGRMFANSPSGAGLSAAWDAMKRRSSAGDVIRSGVEAYKERFKNHTPIGRAGKAATAAYAAHKASTAAGNAPARASASQSGNRMISAGGPNASTSKGSAPNGPKTPVRTSSNPAYAAPVAHNGKTGQTAPPESGKRAAAASGFTPASVSAGQTAPPESGKRAVEAGSFTPASVSAGQTAPPESGKRAVEASSFTPASVSAGHQQENGPAANAKDAGSKQQDKPRNLFERAMEDWRPLAAAALAGYGEATSLSGVLDDYGFFAPSAQDQAGGEEKKQVGKEAEDAARETYQQGNAKAIPENFVDAAERYIAGEPLAKREMGNASNNYKNYGCRDEDGRPMRIDGDGALTPTAHAAAAGISVSDVKGRDGSDHKQFTSETGPAPIASILSQAASGDNFGGIAPTREEYMQNDQNRKRMPNANGDMVFAYEVEGDRAEKKALADDTETVDRYSATASRYSSKAEKADTATVGKYQHAQSAYAPEVRKSEQAVQAASSALKSLETAGASPDKIQMAANDLQTARSAHYKSVVSAGERRVSDAKQAVDALASVPHDSPEYVAAESRYQAAQSELAEYRAAHARLFSGNADTYTSGTPVSNAYSAMQSARNDLAAAQATPGTTPETIQQLRENYADAQNTFYQSAHAAGTQQVQRAEQTLAEYDKAGVSHEAPQYKEAAENLKTARDQLSGFESAYGHISGDGSYYNNIRNFAAAEAKAEETRTMAASYPKGLADLTDALRTTIERCDPYTAASALLDRNYMPTDNEFTRALANKYYAQAISDIMPGSKISNVEVQNHSNGGRSVSMAYTSRDGSNKCVTFFDEESSVKMNDQMAKNMSIYTGPDGRYWYHTGASDVKAQPQGAQYKTKPKVGRYFALRIGEKKAKGGKLG